MVASYTENLEKPQNRQNCWTLAQVWALAWNNTVGVYVSSQVCMSCDICRFPKEQRSLSLPTIQSHSQTIFFVHTLWPHQKIVYSVSVGVDCIISH